jgi:hypothetical protein
MSDDYKKMGGLEAFITTNQTILDRIEFTLNPDPMGITPRSPHQFCSIPRTWMEQLVKLARSAEKWVETGPESIKYPMPSDEEFMYPMLDALEALQERS